VEVRIVRVPAPTGFTQVPNVALRDERLSYKARGIHANLLSNSDEDWNETAETLAQKSPDGRDACRSGLRELAKYGYIEYRKTQIERGRWATDMIVYSVPKDIVAGRTEDGKPALGPTRGNTENPQVAPKTENPSSVGGHRGRKTRSRSDLQEQGIPAGGTESGKPASGPTRANDVSAGRTEDGFSGPIQNTRMLAGEEQQAGDARASASQAEPIPDWALPLVHRIHAAGLPGIRWNLRGDDWYLLHSLMQRKGIDAMADYAARVAASSAKPVFSARYFMSGWKELIDAPPAGNAAPALRAINGGAARPLTGTDATVAGWLALGNQLHQEDQ
jgi:hypothetical protein